MKFLCLAYGDAKDWNSLSKKEQDEMLAQDESLRKRGALMAAVTTDVVKVNMGRRSDSHGRGVCSIRYASRWVLGDRRY